MCIQNMLECLSLTISFRLAGASPKGRLLVFLTNIRLGIKGLPGTNTLAYFSGKSVTTRSL